MITLRDWIDEAHRNVISLRARTHWGAETSAMVVLAAAALQLNATLHEQNQILAKINKDMDSLRPSA